MVSEVELLDKYDLAEEHLKSFTRSKVRTKVLLSLLEGEMSANDLESKLGSRVTTILHAVKEMTESKLVDKKRIVDVSPKTSAIAAAPA